MLGRDAAAPRTGCDVGPRPGAVVPRRADGGDVLLYELREDIGRADLQRLATIDGVRKVQRTDTGLRFVVGDGERDAAAPSDRDGRGALDAWRDRARRSLAALLADLPPRALSVECIDYDFSLIAPVVRALDLSVSLDVGHALRDGRALVPLVDEWLDRAPIVQLHGTRADGRDHKSLAHTPRAELARLLQMLRARQFGGVLTLEVFDPSDLEESLALVRSLVS